MGLPTGMMLLKCKLTLKATKERTFFMAAPSQEDRTEWMEAIQKQIDQVNKSIDSITIE